MNKIKVKMLKEFSIQYNQQEIIVSNILSKKLCELLQMLVYHRDGISKEELIDEFWQDAVNPLNSLKHSIFRLRVLLDEVDCFRGINVIATIKNGYVFAPDYIIEYDYTCMDEYNRILQDNNMSEAKRMYYAEKILDVYRGPFFVSGFVNWSTQIRAYYSGIYEIAFSIVCDVYSKDNRENELIPIIIKAINVDKFYDKAYEYYMKALLKIEAYSKVIRLYQYITELYERELGNSPSQAIKELYESLNMLDDGVVDFEKLKNNLNLDMENPSALYCNYNTFRYIYKFCLNNTIREHKDVFLLILSLHSKEETKKQAYSMMKLKKILCSYLRGGDVLTKINQTQILVLVSCKTIDNCYSIIQRITSKFYKTSSKEKYRIHYFVSSIIELNKDDESKLHDEDT